MDAMNQHKKMAGAGGSASTDSFPVRPVAHPDAGMNTGATMPEGSRAVGAGVKYSKSHLPAQEAPSHGPHNEPAGWSRGGKI